MILYIFYGKIIMGMYVQKFMKLLIFLFILALLGGCGAMDNFLPSTGSYKVNARVNELPLDEFSFVTSKDKVEPFFEEPVSGDPDVTALVVFLRDSRGMIAGYKVTYVLDIESDPEETGQENTATEETIPWDSVPSEESPPELSEITINESPAETVVTGNSTRRRPTWRNSNENNTVSVDNVDNSDNTENVDNADNLYNTNNEDSADNTDDTDNVYIANNDKDEENDEDAEEKLSEENLSEEEPVEKVVELPLVIEYKDGEELIIPVRSLDDDLPFFPIPPNLPIGRYTLVSQVMSERSILQKTEKTLYYLADAGFSFDGIMVSMPGIVESSQLIPNGTVILLEARLDFDRRLEPYIVWYNGRRIISEGKFSDGAGALLWKAPDQSGFFSLRAEAFPLANREELTGYKRGVSLLVSSREVKTNLLPEDTENLIHWYLFDGDLLDSKMITSKERVLTPAGMNTPRWMSANGTYGLVSGLDNAYTLPVVSFANNRNESWQVILSFRPLTEGVIFSVQFGDVTLDLIHKEENFVLSLTSPTETVSGVAAMPEDASFITAAVNFSVHSELLSVAFSLIETPDNQDEPAAEPVNLEIKAEFDESYKIMLGNQQVIRTDDNTQAGVKLSPTFTVIWNELALLYISPEENVVEEIDFTEEEPVEIAIIDAEDITSLQE